MIVLYWAGRTNRGFPANADPIRHAVGRQASAHNLEALCRASCRPYAMADSAGSIPFDPRHPRSCSRCAEVLSIIGEKADG